MTLREWLSSNADDLAATIFMSVFIAIGVGFRKRSTGAAIFASGFTASLISLVAYPEVTAFGYDWRVGISILAPISGACSWALFGVLVKLSQRIEDRSGDIADKIIDRGEGFIGGRREEEKSP